MKRFCLRRYASRGIVAAVVVGGLSHATTARAEGAGFDEEVVVVAPVPGTSALGIAPERLPYVTQAADHDALARTQSLDLTDYMNSNLGSVSINSAQSNPLQPDVQYRGFSASPVLGLPMGISVFQDGVRVNEPLGDAVNWDLIPESAVHSMTLVGGSNPLFGLNTLGGALSIEMKDGFNFQNHALEAAGGSWGRAEMSAESGNNNGTLGYYANVHYLREDGWRDLSPSDAVNLYGSANWRVAQSSADLSVQYGNTKLRGNGPLPLGLLETAREQIFTAPDITENELFAVTGRAKHEVASDIALVGNGFYRNTSTTSFNGDASPFTRCALGNGEFLLAALDDDALAALDLTPAEVCRSNVLNAADPTALATALNARAGSADAFLLDDLTADITGNGTLTDAAINNQSTRDQDAMGTDLQAVFKRTLFARKNYLVLGFSFYRGTAKFDSTLELAELDPATRSTEGLGVGSFVTREATSVRTLTDTWSLYLLENLQVTERFALTLGGRYNQTGILLRDRSGARRELNGEHSFSRFNPTVGGTFTAYEGVNLYASYSESSRAPTPIELACNEGVFEVAQQIAREDGRDPNDVNLECRLPNAFLADPPLREVVAESVESGVRGYVGEVDYRLGYFRTVNNDDIIFQSTGRSTGLFANVDRTQREGLELALSGAFHGLDWFSAYSYIDATFDSPFQVLSPNHPAADANGEVAVASGSRIPGIPRHQLKVGVDYQFQSGLKLGGELMYNSDQVLRGDEANLLSTIAGYAVVNVRAAYRVSKQLEVFTRVTNLFDTDYENFGLLGESPSRVLPNLADATPRYFGPGAPRGGWVGVRVTF